VEVPWFDGDLRSPAERLAAHLSPRTVAIYVNSPHNPTGGLISAAEQQAIAAFAREHGLWIWSDEVYARLQYAGEASPMADFAPERTFSVYSFSKAYGLAGNRCGYVIGPADPPVMLELRKAATHSFYSTPTAAQVSSAIALEQGEGWLEEARQSYAAVGREAARRLGLSPPKGGTFLFLDVRASLDESGIHGLLLRCVDRGLILAPGDACGAQYGHCLRLCFTSAPPEQVLRGVELLAQMLNRSPGLGKEFG
jgi:N-succinyldiaminopimelate aminotransferase